MKRCVTATAVLLLCLVPAISFAGLFSKEIFTRDIVSTPAEAKIFFSLTPDDKGTYLGTTPFSDKFEEKKFPAGFYRAEKNGFKTQVRQVPPPPQDQNLRIDFPLQAITTLNLNITSKPSGAAIFFGTDRSSLTKQVGTTPYHETKSDEQSDEKPSWEKGFYKAVLPGYRPKVIEVGQSAESRDVAFDLEPLPSPPMPPKMEYSDPRKLAYQPVSLDAFKAPGTELNASTPIAVLALKEIAGKDLAGTVMETLILKLQRKGYVVIEREIVEKAITEVSAAAAPPAGIPVTPASSAQPATPPAAEPAKKASLAIELMKQLAEQLKNRYFVIGTLNEYAAGKEEFSVTPTIGDQEKERYQKEYDAYVGYFKGEDIVPPEQVKTLKEWEQECSTKAKTETLPVARVSLTAKILDVTTGKAVWTGMVNSADASLQKALGSVIDAVADSIAQ